MAITKLLRIKEVKGRNKASHLKKNIFYICNPEKTEGGVLIGGNAGITPETVYDTMIRNKRCFQKENGSQGFHYILSFPPDENVTPELAYDIMQEFCQELLGENYYHVFAIHTDTDHLHGHVTFDSVSRVNGLKFHSPKGDWEKRIQPITDRLCEKYHLTTLNYEEKKGQERTGKKYRDWEQEKKERETGKNQKIYTSNDIIRDDIDEAISKSESYDSFIQYLKGLNYTVRGKKYLSLLPEGASRPVRTGRLGFGYSKEDILKRLEAKKHFPKIDERIKTYGDRLYIRKCVIRKRVRRENWKISPYQKAFFRKWNYTYFIRKPEHFHTAWKYREDILRVKNLADQLVYMIEFDIVDIESLKVRRKEVLEEKTTAAFERRRIYTELKQQAPFVLIRELEDLEKEILQYPENTRGDLIARKESIIQELKKYGTVDACSRRYKEMKDALEGCRRALKDIRQELKIIDRIASENLNRPDLGLVFTEEEKAAMQSYTPERYRGKRKRITIHKKMFLEVNESKEEAITRIPYRRDEYLVLPMEDCVLFGEGEVLSAYVYEDEEYRIVDKNRNTVRVQDGKTVIESYEIKQELQKKRKQ